MYFKIKTSWPNGIHTENVKWTYLGNTYIKINHNFCSRRKVIIVFIDDGYLTQINHHSYF